MPRGQPDYGAYAAENYLAGMSDLGELAVRLGSIDIFDRRGKVIDLDDFEAPILGWRVFMVGGGTVQLNSDDPKSGAQGVRLHVGAPIGSLAPIHRGYIPFSSKRLGITISFSQPHNDTYFHASITYWDGTWRYTFSVRIDFLGRELHYYAPGPAYIKFADVDEFLKQQSIFYPIKLVVDLESGKYVRFIMGVHEYDMANYLPYSVAGGGASFFRVRFQLENRVAVARYIYLDDFILTMDEP